VKGTLHLQDRQALETARRIFQRAATTQQHYAGQENAARLLLGASRKTGRGYPAEGYIRARDRVVAE
jgi:hypothetical protein